jgi:hypothetical protein
MTDKPYNGFWQLAHSEVESTKRDAHKFAEAVHNGDPMKMFKTGVNTAMDTVGVPVGGLFDLTLGPIYKWTHSE